MSAKIVVGCKLPHGIIIEHPADQSKTAEINGKNKSLIVGAEYATTEIDGDLWDAWIAKNKDFPALASGAIFVAKSVADASAMAKEFKGRKTGFEAMNPDAMGVKPADKD